MDNKLFFSFIIAAALFFGHAVETRAFGIDPARAVWIERFSLKAQKALKAQNEAQALMTTGHMFIYSEIEATTNFQREFNDYLDSFHDILSFAAEIYGIYYEVTQLSKNVSILNDVASAHPANALAVAFHTRRNAVYRNIIINSIDIVTDVKTLCSEKMTEKEKVEMVAAIRPKLRTMNRQLRALAMAVKYTSFLDVWNEITGRARYYEAADKRAIIEQCMKDWKQNANRK